ncbi:hypothetical protein FKK32_30580, partial [Klebsiella pneumoniae]|nr:hypothetical protein [Klebsiella pneumoniae]
MKTCVRAPAWRVRCRSSRRPAGHADYQSRCWCRRRPRSRPRRPRCPWAPCCRSGCRASRCCRTGRS